MAEIEIAFKIAQNESESVALLEKAGYKFFYEAQTHDLYFCNKELLDDFTEQEIKFSCIRFRHTSGKCLFDNFDIFDKSKPKSFFVELDEAFYYIDMLKKAGFQKIFDTYKTDLVYRKGGIFHQLQNIDNIGLLDYVYCEDIKNESNSYQAQFLLDEMTRIGFTLEYKEGIDKLRSLYFGHLCFSQNQNGNYLLM